MIYVFDTSPFIVLSHFYPDTFPSLWNKIETLVEDGQLTSVREVLNELEIYHETNFIIKWAKEHRSIFTIPTKQELEFVTKIFEKRHFQSIIDSKAILSN